MRKQNQTKKPIPDRRAAVILFLAVLLSAAVIILAVMDLCKPDDSDAAAGQLPSTDPSAAGNILLEDMQNVQMDLGKRLQITDIGSYTGVYMEDGSDEVVARVLMVVVKNTGNATVQYGEVTLTDGTTTASFTVTTLPPGESVVLLEESRMSYETGKNLTQASVSSVAVFPEEPSLCEDQLKIQPLDGVLNITNISGQDITGDIVIYYKNSSSDMLYGGITYRVSITGGLKKDEVRQINSSHFTVKGSRVMFVTCG